MNTSTYDRSTVSRTASAPRTRERPDGSSSRSRLADYIVDVFFVALLAAPFLIFEAPASVQDAVVPLHATAAQASAPAPAAAYGPE